MRLTRVFIATVFSVCAAFAQTNKGGISGTVFDPNGAAVAGATVTVTNLGTNQSIQVTTSESGAYAVSNLDPVTYSVTVEAAGFKKAIVERVKVDTAVTATVNVTLELGGLGEQVTVVSDVPLLNVESGTTSQTVIEREIQDIPLNNRSVLDLAVTLPNVSGDAGSEDPTVTSGQPVPGFNLSLNGGRPGSTVILADGVNNTGVGIARAVVSFTPETVQEFTVQTSAYDASFGSTGGGVINATTKSGTNRFNGVALWYTRNPATNARVWTQGSVRPPNNLRYNQVSVTVGGPVYLPRFGEGGPFWYDGHNRTFFFFAYEPRWRRDFVVTDALLPTDAMRAGDFSNLVRLSNGWAPKDVVAQFPQIQNQIIDPNPAIYRQFNLDPVTRRLTPIVLQSGQTYPQFSYNGRLNVIPPEYLDPTALKALQYLPHAGNYFINNSGQLANYIVNRFVRQDETRYTLRLDHNFTASNRANFRLTVTPAIGLRGFGSDVNGNTGVYSDAKQIVIGDNHTFSPRVVNDLRLSYTRGVFSEDFWPEFSIKGGRNLATELGIPSLTAGGIPLFNTGFDGVNAFASIGSSGSTNNFNVEERYNINDTIYWTRGNMNWKFGVDLSHALLNVIPFFGASGGRWDFRVLNTSNNRSTNTSAGGNVFASLLLGVPNQVLARPLLIPYYYRWNSAAAFVQDDWKVRPNLTLNLGLRYSLQLPRTEKNNLQGVFMPELAKEFPLPTPITVAGRTFTTALVPPFAFAGRGGRSKYIFPPNYLDFEPRFGFAWNPGVPGWMRGRSLVIRGGYGLSHLPLTGNKRLPNPDFGAVNTTSTTATGSTGAVDPTQPVRMCCNPPLYNPVSPEAALNIPPDGLIYLNSLAIPGFAVPKDVKTPYVQNWNLTLQYEPIRNLVVEIAYVGSKGTHLFMPLINLNPRDFDFVELLEANNINADTTRADPLGRRGLNGALLSIPNGSLGTKYLGFDQLYLFYDTSANSIYHAGYISVRRRVSRGLTLNANYTYGKSIDDASDASPDTRVLTVPSVQGHVSFGAPRSADRAVSTFDIKHNFNTTFIYDLPFGRGRQFLAHTNSLVEGTLGGWTVSGVFRLQGGTPFVPSIVDANRLSNITHTIRPDIVPGVPLKNPLWSPNCRVGQTCEPYINPAAFMRPVKGELGNAPRTLDVRGPMQQFFDFSFQKNFPLPWIGEDGRRRVQFRVDLINAFNHPVFRLNNLDFMGLPDETPLSAAEYDAWVAFSPSTRPARSTPAGAQLFSTVQSFITSNRLPSGALPPDYYHIRLPQGFATRDPNSFDISTLEGFKLFRLRKAYSPNFGTLRELGNPRYIQFGIKIYF